MRKKDLEKLSVDIYRDTKIHIPVSDPQLAILLLYERKFSKEAKKLRWLVLLLVGAVTFFIAFSLSSQKKGEKIKNESSWDAAGEMRRIDGHNVKVMTLSIATSIDSVVIGKHVLISHDSITGKTQVILPVSF